MEAMIDVSPSSRALVLFSGGQDSSICLAWALDRFAHVETVGFDYGQRHGVEMAQRLVVRREMAARFPAWAPEDTLASAQSGPPGASGSPLRVSR